MLSLGSIALVNWKTEHPGLLRPHLLPNCQFRNAPQNLLTLSVRADTAAQTSAPVLPDDHLHNLRGPKKSSSMITMVGINRYGYMLTD